MASAKRPFLSKLLIGFLLALSLLLLTCFLSLEATAAAKVQREQKRTTSKGSRLAPLPRLLDRQGLTRLLTRHRGQVVLLNFWATWCEPCRQEFAWLNNLVERYHHRGLVVLAVSVDIPSAYLQVRKFLGQQKPTFPTYVKEPGDEEAFINAVDASWTGALPATFVYNVTGKRVRSMIGEQTRDAFDAAVRDLLPYPDGADDPRPKPGG